MANINFNELNGAMLVHTYNEMVSEAVAKGLEGYRPVARFADKVAAVRRCEVLQSALRARAEGLKVNSAPIEVAAQKVLEAADQVIGLAGGETNPGTQPPVNAVANEESDEDMAKRAKKEKAPRKERTASKVRAPRAPREDGKMTLKQQQEHFNELAERAIKKGVTGVKVHTSTFESYEKGVAAIEKLEEKMAAA